MSGSHDQAPELAHIAWHWNEWRRLRFHRWLRRHGYYEADLTGLPQSLTVAGNPLTRRLAVRMADETTHDPASAGSA